MKTVQDTLSIMQTEAKAIAEETAITLEQVQVKLENTREELRRSAETGEEAKRAAKETMEINKTMMASIREIKNREPQTVATRPTSYAAAAAAARGTVVPQVPQTQSLKTTPAQTQREIIVTIRDPLTIERLRAMNPRNLKSHVERAIAQSENEHIANIKVMSSNQLKSGDLSIKTTNSDETTKLREFAEDWVRRLGNGATVRNPTFGVIAHGIRTSTMDMEKFELNKEHILQDNKPFIPNANIAYIGWLTRQALNKTASSVIIEFTKPEDANKIIDEGIIWQGEVFQCERYDRQCRLKQCFKCQKYGHIRTQCTGTETCGYCAQNHASRECPVKNDNTALRKCANCREDHEAWSQRCSTRKEELAKIKAAYAVRARYHPTAGRQEDHNINSQTAQTLHKRRSARDLYQQTEVPRARVTSPVKRGRKRTSAGVTVNEADKENSPPQRMITVEGLTGWSQCLDEPWKRSITLTCE